jgi:hypothetical protein
MAYCEGEGVKGQTKKWTGGNNITKKQDWIKKNEKTVRDK